MTDVCGREIGWPVFGVEVRCSRERGHLDACSGPLIDPQGRYVGELTDGCTDPPTCRITMVTKDAAEAARKLAAHHREEE